MAFLRNPGHRRNAAARELVGAADYRPVGVIVSDETQWRPLHHVCGNRLVVNAQLGGNHITLSEARSWELALNGDTDAQFTRRFASDLLVAHADAVYSPLGE